MSEPTTEAGRPALVRELRRAARGCDHSLADIADYERLDAAILAIEQEAATRVLDALAGEVGQLTRWQDYRHDGIDEDQNGWLIDRSEVLALIEQHRPRGGPG